jgi:hypothetical protein
VLADVPASSLERLRARCIVCMLVTASVSSLERLGVKPNQQR